MIFSTANTQAILIVTLIAFVQLQSIRAFSTIQPTRTTQPAKLSISNDALLSTSSQSRQYTSLRCSLSMDDAFCLSRPEYCSNNDHDNGIAPSSKQQQRQPQQPQSDSSTSAFGDDDRFLLTNQKYQWQSSTRISATSGSIDHIHDVTVSKDTKSVSASRMLYKIVSQIKSPKMVVGMFLAMIVMAASEGFGSIQNVGNIGSMARRMMGRRGKSAIGNNKA